LTDDGILRSESPEESRMAIDERRLETLERALDERRHDFTELKEAVRHLELTSASRTSRCDFSA
jgi:hypothetical protein